MLHFFSEEEQGILNMSNNGSQTSQFLFFTVTPLEDVGALVDDNLFERDILIATKKLACLSNISERSQGIIKKSKLASNDTARYHYVLLLLSLGNKRTLIKQQER